MRYIPEIFKTGLSACIIRDKDTPEQVVEKIENSAYAIDGRTYAKEILPDYYKRCKRETETKKPTVARHKFF